MNRREENSSSPLRIYGVVISGDGIWFEIPVKDMDLISGASQTSNAIILMSAKDGACVVGGIKLDVFSRLVSKLKKVCNPESDEVYYRIHKRYVISKDDTEEVEREREKEKVVSRKRRVIVDLSTSSEEEEEDGGEVSEDSPPLKYLLLNTPDTTFGIPSESEETDLKDFLGQNYRSELIERRNWMLKCIEDNEINRRMGKITDTAYHTNFDYVMRKAISVGGPQGEDFPNNNNNNNNTRSRKLSDLIDKYSQIFLLKDVVYNPIFRHKTNWIAKQEEILLRYVLDKHYSEESKLLDLIRTNNVETSFDLTRLNESEMDEGLISECQSLFRTRYYGEKMPVVWLSSPCLQWLEVGLECQRGSTTVVRDGRIYFSYKHLQCDVLPSTTKYLMSVVEDSDERKKLTEDHESKLVVMFGDSFSRDEELSNTSRPRRMTKEERENIPDIEDCANVRLLPPCALVHHKKLTEQPHHLKFYERFYYSGLLLSCSFPKDEVWEYFSKNFSKGGTDDTAFRSKYSKCLERREEGQWFVGSKYRKDPYGTGCHKYTTGDFKTDSNNVVGCPFVYKEREALKGFLWDNYAGGIAGDFFDTKKELEATVERAKEMDQPRKACSMLLGLLIMSDRLGDNNDNNDNNENSPHHHSYRGRREEIAKRIVKVGTIGNVSCISMNTPQSFFNLRLLAKSQSP